MKLDKKKKKQKILLSDIITNDKSIFQNFYYLLKRFRSREGGYYGYRSSNLQRIFEAYVKDNEDLADYFDMQDILQLIGGKRSGDLQKVFLEERDLFEGDPNFKYFVFKIVE